MHIMERLWEDFFFFFLLPFLLFSLLPSLPPGGVVGVREPHGDPGKRLSEQGSQLSEPAPQNSLPGSHPSDRDLPQEPPLRNVIRSSFYL